MEGSLGFSLQLGDSQQRRPHDFQFGGDVGPSDHGADRSRRVSRLIMGSSSRVPHDLLGYHGAHSHRVPHLVAIPDEILLSLPDQSNLYALSRAISAFSYAV